MMQSFLLRRARGCFRGDQISGTERLLGLCCFEQRELIFHGLTSFPDDGRDIVHTINSDQRLGVVTWGSQKREKEDQVFIISCVQSPTRRQSITISMVTIKM